MKYHNINDFDVSLGRETERMLGLALLFAQDKIILSYLYCFPRN